MVDVLKVNVQNPAYYGPRTLDELRQTDTVPVDSPQPIPGASSGGVNITTGADQSVTTTTVTNNINQFDTYRKKGAKVLVIDLAAAGFLVWDEPGTFFQCVWGSSGGPPGALVTLLPQDPSCTAVVQFDPVDKANPAPGLDMTTVPFSPGFEWSGFPFAAFKISWPAQAGKFMVVVVSNDRPIDRMDAST